MQEQHNTLHYDEEDLTKQNKTTDVHFDATNASNRTNCRQTELTTGMIAYRRVILADYLTDNITQK